MVGENIIRPGMGDDFLANGNDLAVVFSTILMGYDAALLGGAILGNHVIMSDDERRDFLEVAIEVDNLLLGDLQDGWFTQFTNFGAGWGDTLSMGLTSFMRDLMSYDAVNYDATAYCSGQISGTVHGVMFMGSMPEQILPVIVYGANTFGMIAHGDMCVRNGRENLLH